MTSQILTSNSSIRVSDSEGAQLQTPQSQVQDAEAGSVDQHRSRLIEAMKSQYQVNQQVEFLYLQAEADSLLQQLQALKQQRAASSAQ
jgi:polyhydroxyalkanoate synthesis regulator phasin